MGYLHGKSDVEKAYNAHNVKPRCNAIFLGADAAPPARPTATHRRQGHVVGRSVRSDGTMTVGVINIHDPSFCSLSGDVVNDAINSEINKGWRWRS